MFRTYIDDDSIGKHFETLTRLHTYATLQSQIANALAPYEYVVERYSRKSGSSVQPISEKYLKERPEITEQNVILLGNAIQLWREASRSIDTVAPVLYHYSLHCFISFFNYTFFSWKPEHAQGHGIRIKWSDSIPDIEVQFSKSGIFQRFIDTWTLLGACLAFSPYLPVFEGDRIEFTTHDQFLLEKGNELSLKQILSFNTGDFGKYIANSYAKRVTCPFDSVSAPNEDAKNYLIVFIASSMARYRPLLWSSILVGKTVEQSDFSLASTRALSKFNLRNVYTIIQEIRNGKFKLGRTLHSAFG